MLAVTTDFPPGHFFPAQHQGNQYQKRSTSESPPLQNSTLSGFLSAVVRWWYLTQELFKRLNALHHFAFFVVKPLIESADYRSLGLLRQC